MGVDSYIIFQVPIDVKVPAAFDHLRDSDGNYELCYWQNSFIIRNFILNLAEENYDEALRYYEIPKDKVIKIIKFLSSFNRRNWPVNSFYEWSFAKKMLRHQIKRLKRLRHFRGEYRLIFIDSY